MISYHRLIYIVQRKHCTTAPSWPSRINLWHLASHLPQPTQYAHHRNHWTIHRIMTSSRNEKSKTLFHIDPLNLKFGDTAWIPTHHSVYGAKTRPYVYVGLARSKNQDKDVPVFCTLQTSKNTGPCVAEHDPTTFCRPEISIYTHPCEEGLPSETPLDRKYLAGIRAIRERKTSEKLQFANLCQLAVLEPPPGRLILAEDWHPELSHDFLTVFKRELEHLLKYHKQIYGEICNLYTLRESHLLMHRWTSLELSLSKANAKSKFQRLLGSEGGDNDCGSMRCSLINRIQEALRCRKKSTWAGRRFEKADSTFPQEQETGAMVPFDTRAYQLHEIVLPRGTQSSS